MNNSICTINTSIRKALEIVNVQPAGIAFVNDNDGKLCGVLTDGDVRRLLLEGKELDHCITLSDLGEFSYAYQGEDIDALLKKTNYKIRFLPIVNKDFELADYFRYEHRVHMVPVAEPDLSGRELEYLTDAFLSTWISSRGKYIDRFENDFSKFCGVDYGVSTSNGTVALHLALKALGVGSGDEVIIPDLTFAATINAVIHAGAIPVIVDVEDDFWTICPKEIEKAITSKTKAIIPVHIYGQPCDMESIMDIANKYSLYVIEDCAEAHGATFNGRKVGSFGDISCFSFFGNKIITTGEGGMCVTASSELDERMRMLRDHGMSKEKRYWHEEVGFNYRMTNLQAAIGCAQLERIDDILGENSRLEELYKEELANISGITWQKDSSSQRSKVVWLVTGLVDNRDMLIEQMKKNGLDARPFFYPLSSMPIYKQYSFSSKNSMMLSRIGINFPTTDKVDFQKVRKSLGAE